MALPNPDEKETVTFRMTRGTKDKLSKLADATGRARSFLVEEAVQSFCDLNAWQVEAVQEGLDALERGEVISHDTIKRKWEQKLANTLD